MRFEFRSTVLKFGNEHKKAEFFEVLDFQTLSDADNIAMYSNGYEIRRLMTFQILPHVRALGFLLTHFAAQFDIAQD